MKRVRICPAEDLDDLPEGEWVEVVGSLHAKFVDPPIRTEGGDLIVGLPKEVRRQFKGGAAADLQARISKGSLIVTRRGPSKPKRRK